MALGPSSDWDGGSGGIPWEGVPPPSSVTQWGVGVERRHLGGVRFDGPCSSGAQFLPLEGVGAASWHLVWRSGARGSPSTSHRMSTPQLSTALVVALGEGDGVVMAAPTPPAPSYHSVIPYCV